MKWDRLLQGVQGSFQCLPMFGRYGEPHRQSQPEDMAEASEEMTCDDSLTRCDSVLGALLHYEASETSLPRLVAQTQRLQTLLPSRRLT